MNIDNIYSLRQSFTIIGITGRLGAGCSKVASILSKKFDENNFLLPTNKLLDNNLRRKYKICYDFAKVNWQQYTVIQYKEAVFLHLIRVNFDDLILEINKSFIDEEIQKTIKHKISELFEQNKQIVERIQRLPYLNEQLKMKKHLKELGSVFFSKDFKEFSSQFYSILNSIDIPSRIDFSNRVAINLRSTGFPLSAHAEHEINDNIYCVSETINRLIKALKMRDHNDVHVVIDALRNSIELLFFKERYSAFYMFAVNSQNRRANIRNSIHTVVNKGKLKNVIEEILSIDNEEYHSDHLKIGNYFSPDLQNCIQKCDIHLDNRKETKQEVFTLETQLLKFTSLIQHPGLIPPSNLERCMQVAYTAKFNSGCISRQVGAAICDENFSIKSIGWNDVPKGQVSCKLRDANDLIQKENLKDPMAFSPFEKNEKSSSHFDKVFRHEFRKFYKGVDFSKLNGRNCSFCFKDSYNAYKGDKNQVHTRSLHAEENAMLQISKYGGQGLKNGKLFTTASPCELCSKKAYQLGIKEIFYIDPYPGISQKHILEGGNTTSNPKLTLFTGAIGTAFHKLYEPFMAYKDELFLRIGVKPEVSLGTKMKVLLDAVDIDKEMKDKFISLVKNGIIDEKAVLKMIQNEVDKH